MAKSKLFAVALPPRNDSEPQNISGNAFGSNPRPHRFPKALVGKGFKTPTRPAKATKADDKFGDWVTFFVNLIGSSVERLNGLQSNIESPDQTDQVTQMMNVLGDLADQLNVGSRHRKHTSKPLPNVVENPKELRWPLAGSYIIRQNPLITGWDSFTLDLFFECDPQNRMVTNCLISVVAKGPAKDNTVPQSSSSSIIATGSH